MPTPSTERVKKYLRFRSLTFEEADDYIALLNKNLTSKRLPIQGDMTKMKTYNALMK